MHIVYAGHPAHYRCQLIRCALKRYGIRTAKSKFDLWPGLIALFDL
jgi:hypothetical protein